ncbi:MAG: hypothetical protein H6502_05140 [Candidatus Woesearchaeota archaeon]|nr:MAG: hypothetical protein H6502_05140 [Candidatus Woesearchaeota archaeon]
MSVPTAFVLGLYGATALGIVRGLNKAGIPIKGFHKGTAQPHAADSRYVLEHVLAQSEEEFLERLNATQQGEDEKGVLFATSDEYALFCQDHAAELEERFHIPLARTGSVTDLLSKEQNALIGEQAGFSVPHTQLLSTLNQNTFKGPVLAKPLSSVGTSKQDISIYQNVDELILKRGQLLHTYGDLVVQDYVPGGTEDHIEVHTYLTKQGPIILGMLKKVLAKKNGTEGSVGVIAESAWMPELVEPSLALTESLQFSGPLDINLKRDAVTGKFYFLEVNLRCSSNLSLDTAAGRNAPATHYFEVTGLRPTSATLPEEEFQLGVRWLHEERLMNYLSTASLAESRAAAQCMRRIGAFVYFDPLDPLPYFKLLKKMKFPDKL